MATRAVDPTGHKLLSIGSSALVSPAALWWVLYCGKCLKETIFEAYIGSGCQAFVFRMTDCMLEPEVGWGYAEAGRGDRDRHRAQSREQAMGILEKPSLADLLSSIKPNLQKYPFFLSNT